ncbi:MAG: hypothetical protein ACOC55_01930 [Candidatus Natronoplasma sp.]
MKVENVKYEYVPTWYIMLLFILVLVLGIYSFFMTLAFLGLVP